MNHQDNSTNQNNIMDKLFSTKEAADFLHKSVRTFKYWIKKTSTKPLYRGAKGAKFYSGVQLERVGKF